MKKIGIDDIAFYIPRSYVENKTIAEMRGKEVPSAKEKFINSIEYTAQYKIRIPLPFEDIVTMGAKATLRLYERNKCDAISYFFFGTESSVDMSKPASNYVLGALCKAGVKFNENLMSFQIQHACASGTGGMFAALAMIASTGGYGLVTASDIAKYNIGSTAELTQGAGAISLLLKENPRLLEVDLSQIGLYSSDVDDFFRPCYTAYPSVKGRFSVECYKEALKASSQDLERKSRKSLKQLVKDCSYFVFHLPFAGMNKIAQEEIFELSQQKMQFYTPKYFINAESGNAYSASAYINLYSVLYSEYRAGIDLTGKKIMFFSYGSGNTMLSTIMQVSEQYKEVLSKWDVFDTENTEKLSFEEYERLMKIDKILPCKTEKKKLQKHDFYLDEIREDGYRIYSFYE